MASIEIDDRHLEEIVNKAVEGWLRAQKRPLTKEIEDMQDSFAAKAKAELLIADAAIEKFKTDMEAKKVAAEKTMNIRIIGGFTAIVLLLSVAALAYVADRLVTVNTKVTDLSTASDQLKRTIDAATLVNKQAFEADKDADMPTRIRTQEALTVRVNQDLQGLQQEFQNFKKQAKPALDDYAARHPQPKQNPAH